MVVAAGDEHEARMCFPERCNPHVVGQVQVRETDDGVSAGCLERADGLPRCGEVVLVHLQVVTIVAAVIRM